MNCWEELDYSSEGGMTGLKLPRRMESVEWHPPILTFTIERHGGTMMGSTRAELQHWSVDIQKGTAILRRCTHRQLRPMASRVNVKPIAESIAVEILAGAEVDYLDWKDEQSVHVVMARIFPNDSGYRETVQGRRKRLRVALEELLAPHGWVHEGGNYFARRNASSTGS